MSRLIDANEVVKAILEERDKIPRTVPAASYELVAEKPFNHGNSMRGGIRKALRCIEQAPTVDAVPVVRCCQCKDGIVLQHSDFVVCHRGRMKKMDFCSYGEKNVFYKYNGRVKKAYHKATLIAISCYLGIAVEELIEGTDAEDSWYK